MDSQPELTALPSGCLRGGVDVDAQIVPITSVGGEPAWWPCDTLFVYENRAVHKP